MFIQLQLSCLTCRYLVMWVDVVSLVFKQGLAMQSIVIMSTVLPSAHQIEDKVTLDFGDCGSIINCEVIKVHFSESKVMYDVVVRGIYQQTQDHPAGTWTTRLYNVDSCFVTSVN